MNFSKILGGVKLAKVNLAWVMAAALLAMQVIAPSGISTVLAAPDVTITPATGGTDISIDTTSAPGGTGDWASITGPIITEGAVGDISVGTHTLTLPTDWEFNTSQDVTITLNGTDLVLASNTITPGTTTLSFEVTGASSVTPAVLTFSDIKVRPTGTSAPTSGNMTYSGAGILGVDGSTNFGTFSTVPGVATQYVILDPTDGTVDAPISVTVQLQDQFGNVVTDDPDSGVTLNANGSATGGGLVDIVAGVGIIDISDTVTETVNLTLFDSEGTGLDVSSTQDVFFDVGATSVVNINPAPTATVVAGVDLTFTAAAYDQYGNLITSDVTLFTWTNATNGVFNETVTGDYDVDATYDSVTSAATTVTVTHAAATQYVILDPTDGTVDAPITVTVQLQDQFGNVVTDGAYSDTDVTLNANGSATGEGIVDIVNGVGTLDIFDTVVETVNLNLFDTGDTGLDVSSTQDVIFAVGATSVVNINPAPTATVVAGEDLTFAAEARDQFGNLIDDVEANFTWAGTTATDSPVFNEDIVGDYDVTATYDSVTSAATTVTVTHAAATQYVILDPTDGTVDAPITVTVQLQDQFGNVVTDGAYSDTDVTLNANGSATGEGIVDIVNGVGTLDIFDTVVETVNLNLFDTGDTGLDVSSTQDVIFAVGAVDHVGIDPSIPTDVVAGVDLTFTAAAYDQYGNLITSDVTLFTWTNATDGVFNQTLVGDYDVTATYDSVTSAATTVTVTPDVANKYVILDPTDGTVDAPITVTVQLQDQFGNVVNSDTDVTLNTDGSATGGGVVDIVAGVGTLPISDTVTETVNLTLFDSEGTGLDVSSTQDVIFAVGAVDHVGIDPSIPTDVVAGVDLTFTAAAYDQYGNLITSDVTLFTWTNATNGVFNETVTGDYDVDATYDSVTSAATTVTVTPDAATKVLVETAADGSGTVVPAQDLTSGSSLTVYSITRDQFDNFVENVVADDWSLQNITGGVVPGDLAGGGTSAVMTGALVGTANIRATSGALDVTQSGLITVTPGDLASITISPDTATITAGETQTYTAEGYDAYGNSLGDVTAGTTFTIDLAAGGSWAANVYTAEKAGNWTVTGTNGAFTDDAALKVTPGATSVVNITPAPTATVVAGVDLPFTAGAYDQYGNLITSDVTLFTWTNATDGVFNQTLVGDYDVTATYDSVTSAVTVVTVTPGDLASITVSPDGNSITTGGTQTFTAESFDAYDNSRGDVTGTTTFTVVSGGGSFTGNVYTPTTTGAVTVRGTNGAFTDDATLTVTQAGGGGGGGYYVTYFTLTYVAGANGVITGTSPQTMGSGGSGTTVIAVPNAGYHFVNWSDASIANPRTDTNVTSNITVTANFAIDQVATPNEAVRGEQSENDTQPTVLPNPALFNYQAVWVSQSGTLSADKTAHVITGHAGDTIQLSLTLKNTGKAWWYFDLPDGAHKVKLGTWNPQDRISSVHDVSWLSDNRVQKISQIVPTGGSYTFNFSIKILDSAALGTSYREYFRPVAEYVEWFGPTGIFWDIQVN